MTVNDPASISDMKTREIAIVSSACFERKKTTVCFSNCFTNANAETADDWLGSFSFAWNQRI